MSTKTIEVEIKGLSPLLMHKFPLEPVDHIEKKSKEEQAEFSAYRDANRDLYVPAVAVQRSLIGAATYSKGKGRSSLQKQAAACLLVYPEYLNLGTKEYVIDSRAVVIAATKGRIVRHRPRIDEWKIKFNIDYDPNLLKESDVRHIVDDSGSRVGLLDFRPERKGSFGRFIVTSWN